MFQAIFISLGPGLLRVWGGRGSLGPKKLTDLASDGGSPRAPTSPIQETTSKGLIKALAQPATELTVFALAFIPHLWHCRPQGALPRKREEGSASLALWSLALIWKGGWVMWEIECPASYRWQLITTETALSWHQHSSLISGRKIERMKVVG